MKHRERNEFSTSSFKGAEQDAEEEYDADKLSRVLLLQCGEVVKQAALPTKKVAPKVGPSQIKAELERSQKAVAELRAVVEELKTSNKRQQEEMMAMMSALLKQTTSRQEDPSPSETANTRQSKGSSHSGGGGSGWLSRSLAEADKEDDAAAGAGGAEGSDEGGKEGVEIGGSQRKTLVSFRIPGDLQ
eukprot:TRINITY_DN8999_c0_g3_i3.p1 TRINITY_DN8999_c0_g3~~TRINITY_DN8999_c0_g3_i3.p1  ORF type:complete len:205 (-),score=25.61 TRINITY_DN8999_c0_g3_i3:26-589(-)